MRFGVLLASAFIAATSPAHAQGLFEMLFGQSGSTVRPSGPIVRYASREVGQVRRHAPNSKQETSGEVRIPSLEELSGRRYVEPMKPGPYSPPPVLPGHLGRFLRDPTLRPGDVVATEKGLMVFRGSGGSRHAESEFVPVNSAKQLVGDKLPMLVKMDRELRRSSIVVVEQEPVERPTIIASMAQRKSETTCRAGFICREARRTIASE